MSDQPFVGFPKIARLSRQVIVTEKIDGTNAQVWIDDLGQEMKVGCRNQWITKETDNFGFHKWCMKNQAELMKLGPGSHFGEWWGAGIQRRYGLDHKRFSLFNVGRWTVDRPACCHVVPTLWEGIFTDLDVNRVVGNLAASGSLAAPGFMKPEGIVIYHVAARQLFKKTIENDEKPKGSKEEG